MASVVLHGGSDVSAVDAVGVVGSTVVGAFVDENLHARWSEWGFRIIKWSVYLGVG